MLKQLGVGDAAAVVQGLGYAIAYPFGIKSGEKFVSVLLGSEGVRWLVYGALITIVPLLIIGFVARAWKKLNYAELCGLLAGSMTDPPALAFARQTTGSDAPAVA